MAQRGYRSKFFKNICKHHAFNVGLHFVVFYWHVQYARWINRTIQKYCLLHNVQGISKSKSMFSRTCTPNIAYMKGVKKLSFSTNVFKIL